MNTPRRSSEKVPDWKIDKWITDIQFSEMKNHVVTKKIEIACRLAVANWPRGYELNPENLKSEAYKILVKSKVSEAILKKVDTVAIDEKYASPYNDR